MGDADRPEDVIARTLMCELDEMQGEQPEPSDVHDARRVLAALTAAGYAVVPQADVDLATHYAGKAVEYKQEKEAAEDAATRWKAEAIEVIERWELVYEALGDVGGLG